MRLKLRGNPYGNGRAIFSEQVVALLGRLIGAPVPEVRLVTITAELLALVNIDLGGHAAAPGLHHGSCWANGFSDRMDFVRYRDRNREAFAALHLLYSWLQCAGDQQDAVPLDPAFAPLDLLPAEYGPALDKLEAVAADAIADVVSTPPEEWGISRDDRMAFAGHISRACP